MVLPAQRKEREGQQVNWLEALILIAAGLYFLKPQKRRDIDDE